MTAEMRWFRSAKVGLLSFRVRKQMSYSASLSAGHTMRHCCLPTIHLHSCGSWLHAM